jgi:predicted MFS family arabinose efflux permease
MALWALVCLCAIVGLLVSTPMAVACRALGRHDPELRRLGHRGLACGLAATFLGITLFYLVVYLRHFTLEP